MALPHSILDILRRRADDEPARPAFVSPAHDAGGEVTWTYRDLIDRAAAVARSLRDTVPAGERVLLLHPDGLAFLQAFFGCLLAGCIPVPLPPLQHRRHLDRIRRVQRDCLAAAAIVPDEGDACAERGDGLTVQLGLRCLSVETLVAGGAETRDEAAAPEIAFLQYTSGSTGDPKGAIVTHAGILANQQSIQRCFGHDATSIVVGWLPLFHDMGLIGNILQSIYCGIPCVLLPTARVLQQPALWLRAISRYRATTSGGPDFMYAYCAARVRPEEKQGLDLSTWKVAFNGSEPIRAETLAAFVQAFASCGFRETAFLPCYGLAEATLFVTGQAAGRGARLIWAEREALARRAFVAGPHRRPESAPLVSCGGTWDDTRVRIVDPESGATLPPGQVGEVLIQGAGVVPGYWGNRNSSSTITAGAAGQPPTLRTGDLGFLDAGDLMVVGRLKDTLIVRGRNLYAADLEAVAQSAHASLYGRRGAAFARETAAGESMVLVHEAPPGEAEQGATIGRALCAHLAEEFGVTPDVILLTRPGLIPVTTSGKVQRSLCRTQLAAGELPIWHQWRATFDERTLIEALIAAAANPDASEATVQMRAALPSELDLATTLTALGLDSSRMLSLGHEIEVRTGIRIAWASLATATLEELVGQLRSSPHSGPRPSAALADAAVPEVEAAAPLSPGQRALWYLHLLAPRNRYWHLARSLHLEGLTHHHALAQTQRRLVARHPSLRAILAYEHGDWVQRDAPDRRAAAVLRVDLTRLDGVAADRILSAAAARPFAPDTGTPFRAVCFDRPGGAILQLAVHHLAADLWSVGILLREYLDTYDRFSRGLPSPLPLVRGRYAAFAHRQAAAEREGSSRVDASRLYWQSLLDDAVPVARLPWDRPDPSPTDLRTAGCLAVVPAALSATIRQRARAEGCTVFVVLLAAFELLIGRLAGASRALIGTVLSGRAEADLAGVVGYFAKAVPARIDLSGDPSFRALIAQVSADVRAALSHQDFSIERLGGQAGRHRPPRTLFETVFVYQGPSAVFPALTGSLAVGADGDVERIGQLRVRPLASSHAVPQFPLTVTVSERHDQFLVHVSYRTSCYTVETARQLAGQFQAVLQQGVDEPDRCVSQFAGVSVSPIAWPTGQTLQDRFREIAASMPDRIAVSAEQQLTYAALDRESDRVARAIPAGEPVIGVCLGNTAMLGAAILGILKSGAAYLPVAPTWPAAYVSHVLGAAGVRVVVTSRDDRARVPEGFHAIDVDREADSPSDADGQDPTRARREEAGDRARALAYLIYTSGSTGDPKAVSVSHGHVLRLLTAARTDIDFGRDDVWTLFHAISFDFSVWEFWGPLACGGRLEIPSRDVCRDPAAFAGFLVDRQVTLLNQTPTAFAALQRSWIDAGMGAVRAVIFGGEPLDFRLLAPSMEVVGRRPAFVNMYGITETTVHVTYHPIAPAEVIAGDASYIGRPLADLRTYVLDPSLRPVPVGEVGEIHVGGAGVSNGYWRRPEATAERFLPDPFSTIPGSRLYRSGDRARLLPGGRLVFLGRRDTQVKLRGHRIELGAIESALRRHRDVTQVVVLFEEARTRRALLQVDEETRASATASVAPPVRDFLAPTEPTSPDAGSICACIVRAEGRAASVAALRAFAAQSLPDYMVPARWVFLDRLPRTVNGKVDTQALRALASARPELEEAFVAPRTPIESALAEIWAAALGVQPIGIDDNLFELGGDSIRSLRIVGMARERGVAFALAQLLELQTIRLLAAAIATPAPAAAETIAGASVTARVPLTLPDGVEDAYPLARLQEGILYHRALDPDPSLYRDVFLYQFRSPLDRAAMRESVRQVTRRHPVLRTAFDLDSFAEPMQLVHADVAPHLEVVDDWQGSDADPARALLAWAERERHRQLPLDQPPPQRVFVLPVDAGSFHLALSFHDALLDGWSASLLLADLVQRYQAMLAGTPLPVEPLPRVSFRDFILAERAELRRPEATTFWREALAGYEPCLAGRGEPAGGVGLAVVRVPIAPELSAQLIALANVLKTPLKSVLLAAHVRVLASWLGRTRVVTGLESNGRLELTGADEALGLHLNTLPFAIEPGGGSWADLVRAVFAAERTIWPFRRYPLSEIAKERGRGELFDSVFNFTHFHHLRRLESLDGLTVLGARGLGSTHFALRAEFNRDPFRDLVQLDLELDTGRFPAAERAALAAAYAEALGTLAAHARTRRHQDFVARDARAATLSGTALPAVSAIAPATVRARFDEIVRQRPDGVALTFRHECLTYRALDRAAAALAQRLRAMGLRRGERIGICLHDPAETMLVMIAATKLACPYVPLDPDARLERLGVVVQEARLGCLIAGRDDHSLESLRGLCRLGIVTLAIDAFRADATRPPFVDELARPDDVVYVVFTSGSTGTPKGVPVNGRNLWASLEARERQYPEVPRQFILLPPLFFDSSVAVVWGTLYRGGTIVIPAAELVREPGAIADWICRHQVTHLLTLPRVYAALLDLTGLPSLRSLRRVIVAGEACQPAQVLRHFRVLPEVAMTNEYGPTESTVWSTAFECRDYRGQSTVPIGYPVAGLTVRLLGPGLHPVRPGDAGELHLAGPAIVQGYFLRPDLTAASFVPDPFAMEPGARLYRTGDRARLLPSGGLEFLGRTDRQMKIRGHRVEPAEIEAVLAGCAGVAESCVTIDPATRQLVSFVTSRPGLALDAHAVREHAARWLPEPMRPHSVQVVQSLPRTATGKRDLAQLLRAAAEPAGSAVRQKG